LSDGGTPHIQDSSHLVGIRFPSSFFQWQQCCRPIDTRAAAQAATA